jgi:hypothetical protein
LHVQDRITKRVGEKNQESDDALKNKFIIAVAVMTMLCTAPVYAEQGTQSQDALQDMTTSSVSEISLSSATVSNKTITVKGKLTRSVPNCELTMLASDIVNNNINEIFYINQSTPQLATDGTFTVRFNINKLLSTDGVYIVRFGGTNITKCAQLIITVSNGTAKVLLGDVDLDGIITANDAALTLQYVLNHTGNLSEKQISAMYVTDDDIVTANNAATILAKVLNNMYIFPITE